MVKNNLCWRIFMNVRMFNDGNEWFSVANSGKGE